MRGMRRRAVFALLLLSLCVPAMNVSAEAGSGQAEYTVEYIARDQGTETLLARETYRAPAGRRVNVPHRDFDQCEKEPGQDMTILVTADGKGTKKIYYTRLFYDRVTFQTEGTYIPPLYGWAGQDIRNQMGEVEEPVRQGYIFQGWDQELPEVMPEGETEVRTARTGSRVTASREDVERAGEMADWFPDFGILRGLLWV